jgi:hypothetical protein
MTPQAIALAIACLVCFAFQWLAERFICLVHEELTLLGNLGE